MKRAWIFGILLSLAPVAGWSASQNNRPVPRADVANRNWASDWTYAVRFTTDVPANTATLLVGTATFNNLVVAPGIATSPTIAGSTTTLTYGGRAYLVFQDVRSVSNVSVDFDSAISTVTSPFITQGQWWSPDDPDAWQGPVYVMSPSSFTVTGWMKFDRPRTP